MTINEIETTLATLASRHPDLDEAMLTTLLLAAGWDDRSRNDALTIFRAGVPTKDNHVLLPGIEQEKILPPQIENDHLLEEHNTPTVKEETQPQEAISEPAKTEEQSPEPESLVEPLPVSQIHKENDIPENLPVRPFETTPHIWSFSHYKDVFHGAVMPRPEKKEEVPEASSVFTPPKTQRRNKSVDKKDESLVLLAGVCLITIIILLGYMYSNGRL